MTQLLKELNALSEDQGLVSRTHPHIGSQSQEVRHPLLASVETVYVVLTDVHAKHSYT